MSSNFPPPGDHEILSSSGGDPAGVPTRGSGRRTALIAGGIVGGVALVGGVAWAATWYFSSGPDAAEALPDSTIGYASINLDPSGDQKIEALKTLNKFPGFKAELKLDATDDIRKELFEELQKDGTCTDVDYDDDIEPWLGDRMAVAAVDLGEDEPTAVFVVQVSDKDKAEDGIHKLQTCDTGDSGDESDSDEGSATEATSSRATGRSSPRPRTWPRRSSRRPARLISPTTRTTSTGPTKPATTAS